MKKLSATFITDFINSRNTREKIFFMFLFIAIVFSVDFMLLVQPVMNLFMKGMPKQAMLKQELVQLKEDQKNAKVIEKNYLATKDKHDKVEQTFIQHDQVPELLQTLSQLASQTGVHIVSLKPLEEVKSDEIAGFSLLPIEITALAGTHELGRFLAKLEGGETYFRVRTLDIQENLEDTRKHTIKITIETYRKG